MATEHSRIVDSLRCIRCSTTKTWSEFNFNDKCFTGLDSWCKECRLENHKNLRVKNKEYFQLANYKGKLKLNYDMTKEEYELRLEQQQGRCALCFSFRGKKKLSVDHCHKSGKFRGLLCNKCNLALGMFGDSIEWIDRAREYLLKNA